MSVFGAGCAPSRRSSSRVNNALASLASLYAAATVRSLAGLAGLVLQPDRAQPLEFRLLTVTTRLPGRATSPGAGTPGEREVPEVVGAELPLGARGGGQAAGYGHRLRGVVDEQVQRRGTVQDLVGQAGDRGPHGQGPGRRARCWRQDRSRTMAARAARPRSASRLAGGTCAPWHWRSSVTWKLQCQSSAPVTSAVRPCWSGISAALHAVGMTSLRSEPAPIDRS